ncbi:hypothetical protein QWY15_08555 [Planococcus sp. N064]|uniref:DUF7669 domain-containing protein n=1 Tax=Planococcus liqunii TaxID=3058394 RepID=A0ABT8MRJ4_9BACL|nr:hypothetical protein [Planococcus sp. N064]MDN7227339.1 hypothetical protein [Planococcus sp. N064]
MTTNQKSRTTARDEILSAVKVITQERQAKSFKLEEVLILMKSRETTYKESTIRTHITSRCCANSPNHHGSVYNDYERIGKGLYRLI